MPLLDLDIENFRNITKTNLTFDQKITVFLGENGQGKTNLLEAIFFILGSRSFRTKYLANLIRNEAHKAFLGSRLNIFNSEHFVKILIHKAGKTVFFDEKKLHRLSSFQKHIFPMVFSAETIFFFRNFPSYKRSFFDRAICFEDKLYLSEINNYTRLIKQKRQLLKIKGEDKVLSSFDELIARQIIQIVKKRSLFIEKLNRIFKTKIDEVLGSDLPLKIVYTPTVVVSYEEEAEKTIKQIKQFFLHKRDYELKKQQVMFGPHLDSYRLKFVKKDKELVLSEGQFKFFFYSMQFCLAKILEENGLEVVFLIDDVFSELDARLSQLILKNISQKNNQTFLTTTNKKGLDYLKNSQTIRVSFSKDLQKN